MVVKSVRGLPKASQLPLHITMAVQKEEGQLFKVRIRGKANKRDILISVIDHPSMMKMQVNCS